MKSIQKHCLKNIEPFSVPHLVHLRITEHCDFNLVKLSSKYFHANTFLNLLISNVDPPTKTKDATFTTVDYVCSNIGYNINCNDTDLAVSDQSAKHNS